MLDEPWLVHWIPFGNSRSTEKRIYVVTVDDHIGHSFTLYKQQSAAKLQSMNEEKHKEEDHEYCCEKGRRIAGEFCDRMSVTDRGLYAIGRLCEAVMDGEMVDQDLFREIGYMIRNYLDKKWVVENFYFNRFLDDKWIGDLFIASEKMKLKDQSSVFSDKEEHKENEEPEIKVSSEDVTKSS